MSQTKGQGSYSFNYLFEESEFLDIMKNMKPYVEERMKMEPFPWLPEYFVDMDELYTELTLEKIENTLVGEKYSRIKKYKDMFELSTTLKRNKIFIKAGPGMGKTTLGRKIGHDWSKGIFNKFTAVFFVALKLVEQGESIENAILKQHGELQGLNVTEQKLSVMLELFGEKCLLILDGLDEHGLGKNTDVLKVIKNEKLLGCNIIVSSRTTHCP